MEPLGHFPVNLDIDNPQKLSELAAEQQSTSRSSHASEEVIGQGSLSAGGSGVVKHSQPKKDRYVAFGGHAHTLSSASKEQDVRPKVRSGNQQTIAKTISESSSSLNLSDIRQSHSNEGEQVYIARDATAMETDRGELESGTSSPMEVDQSAIRGFPTMDDATSVNQQRPGCAAASSQHSMASGSAQGPNTVATEKAVYVSKKLGPGYTVLMKQPAPGSFHSTEEGEDDDEGTT